MAQLRSLTAGIFVFIAFSNLSLSTQPAQAIEPGLTLNGGQTYNLGTDFTAGWEFVTTRPLVVDALGVFDFGSSGLNSTYNLGLWDASQHLLASTTVSGSGDQIVDNFVWKNLGSLVTLAPGNYVVAAYGHYGNIDRYALGGTYTTLSGVSFVKDRYATGATFQYPSATSGASPAWFGGNFSEKTSEPVPAPLGILAASSFFSNRARLRKLSRQFMPTNESFNDNARSSSVQKAVTRSQIVLTNALGRWRRSDHPSN
jgi:hypothetical protein